MIHQFAKHMLPVLALAVSASELVAQPAQPAQPGQSSLRQRLATERPSMDRNQFRLSAESVARADLLACRNQDKPPTRLGDLTVEGLSRALHGVWINRNGRTVHGLPVDTDTVFYINMQGNKGTAVLIDRNNLGKPVLTPAFQPGGRFARAAAAAQQPLFFGQVSCAHEFVDHYVKASDQVSVQALATTTSASLPRNAAVRGNSLKDVWTRLVEAKYFEFLDMPTRTRTGPTSRVRHQLGDRGRTAVLPEGGTVTEGGIQGGQAPGTEYHLPMLTGGYFDITLTPIRRTVGGREYQGVRMRWDAEYRGTGIASNPGAAVAGVEEGEFFAEGAAIVSARAISGDDAWTTSSCADKNGLTTLVDRVADPASVTRTAELAPELVFERFVIGRP